MNLHRERIIAVFESLKTLLCDLGFFAEGSEGNGIFVRYWGNRRIRQLATYRNGKQDGFTVRAFGPANPPLFSHFRKGEPFGETLRYFSNGKMMEHVLLDGEEKIPYSEEAAKRFRGYLTTDREEELYREFDLYFPKGVFM